MPQEKKNPGAETPELQRLGEKIRTSGLLNPIQARYQTAPHPVIRQASNEQHASYHAL